MNGLKYRKRPVIVEARRFQNHVFTRREWLAWCPEAHIAAAGRSAEESLDSRDLVFWLHGREVFEGDYVIREKSGEFSVCSATLFEWEFEPAYG